MSRTSFALDHVFVCAAVGAPEADALLAAGFTEGAANVHPGQGTACRRFFFENAFLELLWVHDEAEARSAVTAPTRLWERWRDRADRRTCPFGVGLRPAAVPSAGAAPPFPTWPYRPRYLPPGVAMPVATNGDALHEPMLFLLPFPRRAGAAGGRTVTRVALAAPPAPPGAGPSAALAAVVAAGVVEPVAAPEHALVLGLDGVEAGRELDLRPMLPLILRW